MPVTIDEGRLLGLFPELGEIADSAIRRGVTAIWTEVAAECPWDDLRAIPKNLEAEKERRLTDHIRIVTRMALALAEVAKAESGTAYNRDHLIAMALLHDVSKPMECEPVPGAAPNAAGVLPARKSRMGKLIQHAVYATHKVFAHGLPIEIAHVVNTHTHQSAMRSVSVEGGYIFYADYADSDSVIIPDGGRSYLGRWHMA
ncbi:HD domain-containing protein [Muricoccus radiodurans]|uniref:HD domain-containing protein n=1 Tax=Muricoccus radiodurans TaxID=2231721 RepID=UPI003CF7ACF5